MLFLRWIPHRVSPFCAWPRRPKLVCGFHGPDAPIRRRADRRVELDTSVELDVSVNGSCGETVGADVTADAYIEDIKYCPFCGEEL